MRLSRPLAVAAAVVLLAAAYAALWLYAADRIRDGIAAWTAEERRDGTDVQFTGLSVGGFPFAVTVAAADVRLARADGLVWESKAVTASARPWSWRRIDFVLPSGQRTAFADLPWLAATAARGRGHLQLEPNGDLAAARLELDSLAMSLPGTAGLLTAAAATGAWTRTVPNGGGPPVVVAEASVESITLPEQPLPDLGSTVQIAGLDLTMAGALPPAVTEPELTAWRDGGGLAAVDRFVLVWGPLSVEGAGTVSLDPELQPKGSVTVDVKGFLALVDALAAAGHLEERTAGMAKAALSLLARSPGEDGRAILTAPLTLRKRQLTLGPLVLGTLPRIDWPGG